MTIDLNSLGKSVFRGHGMRRMLKQVPLVVAFWMIGQSGVGAAEFTPTTLTDDALAADTTLTLREAVIAANASSVDDKITLSAGRYVLSMPNGLGANPASAGSAENNSLTGDLDITRTAGVLTIEGVAGGGTIIDAASIDRVFHITNGAQVVFKNVTITGGLATDDGNSVSFYGIGGYYDGYGGGILNEGGVVTLDNATIKGNQAKGSDGTDSSSSSISGGAGESGGEAAGGGIYSGNNGSVTLTNSVVTENVAQGGTNAAGVADGGSGGAAYGAGIYHDGGTLTLNNSSVTKNENKGGAGLEGTNDNGGGGGGAPSGNVAAVRVFGGQGGYVAGAGIYAAYCDVDALGTSVVSENKNTAGSGGFGTFGRRRRTSGVAASNPDNNNGPGYAGDADGAGIYLDGAGLFADQAVKLTVDKNVNMAGHGGRGFDDTDYSGEGGAPGGTARGAGIFVSGLSQQQGPQSAGLAAEPDTSSLIAGVNLYVTANTNTGGNGGAGGNGGINYSSSSSQIGGRGGSGGEARGAGIYIQSEATVSLGTSHIDSNTNTGGVGGTGGTGGYSYTSSDSSVNVDAARGGAGGSGGEAFGAGIYSNEDTSVTLTASSINTNSNVAGLGGDGGTGGYGFRYAGSTVDSDANQGGRSGSGGDTYGGGIYAAGATLTLSSTTVSSNILTGGKGGTGGHGGTSITSSGSSQGNGGSGGESYGGGIYAVYSNLTLTSTTVDSNIQTGGGGGDGGGNNSFSGSSARGDGGDAGGGGIYAYQTLIDISGTSSISKNENHGGIGGYSGNPRKSGNLAANAFDASSSGGVYGGGLFLLTRARPMRLPKTATEASCAQ